MQSSEAVYIQELSSLGQGLPLWDPEPTTHGKVHIGDVGYIYRGAFFRLFNTMSEPTDPKNFGLTVPDCFTKLTLTTEDLEYYDACAIQAAALCSRTITARCVEAGLQASRDQGAMLIMSDDAERREVHPNLCMPQYMRKDYQHWLRLARDVRGHDLKQDEIYFIRGTVKTSTWAVAAFHQSTDPYSGNISLGYGSAGLSLSATSSTQTCRTPEIRSGPRRAGTSSQATIPDRANEPCTPFHGETRDQSVFSTLLQAEDAYFYWSQSHDGCCRAL
ncbi:hypothetical protein OBBRIDRAFT_783187 [Obba rivulosa]|uniref:Uncharacterized protein n=1 Tax=Obba rivulosa TaxID=1052685 RepID=A0A8E2ANF0_9APHY|nr:hypothetical protein OBBRIDRAFT_783187 [Obba rivulosa]